MSGQGMTPLRRLAYWIRDIGISVLVATVVILFLYQPVKVEGTSMMPALVDDERVFINKFSYRFGLREVERGDTVVFWYPGDPTKSYIKRAIGLAGDTVEIREGVVLLNGRVLREPYVPAEFRDRGSAAAVLVPPDSVYVLGDHRSSSNDSRHWGPVSKRYIYGRAVFVYWPLERLGSVP